MMPIDKNIRSHEKENPSDMEFPLTWKWFDWRNANIDIAVQRIPMSAVFQCLLA